MLNAQKVNFFGEFETKIVYSSEIHMGSFGQTTFSQKIYGSNGGSLVVSSNCKPPSSPRFESPEPIVDCQFLDGLPSGMVLHCRLYSEGRQRRKKYKIGLLVHQKKLRKTNLM
jgi:hypothetical protein